MECRIQCIIVSLFYNTNRRLSYQLVSSRTIYRSGYRGNSSTFARRSIFSLKVFKRQFILSIARGGTCFFFKRNSRNTSRCCAINIRCNCNTCSVPLNVCAARRGARCLGITPRKFSIFFYGRNPDATSSTRCAWFSRRSLNTDKLKVDINVTISSRFQVNLALWIFRMPALDTYRHVIDTCAIVTLNVYAARRGARCLGIAPRKFSIFFYGRNPYTTSSARCARFSRRALNADKLKVDIDIASLVATLVNQTFRIFRMPALDTYRHVIDTCASISSNVCATRRGARCLGISPRKISIFFYGRNPYTTIGTRIAWLSCNIIEVEVYLHFVILNIIGCDFYTSVRTSV